MQSAPSGNGSRRLVIRELLRSWAGDVYEMGERDGADCQRRTNLTGLPSPGDYWVTNGLPGS
jgi:hypothetical protein